MINWGCIRMQKFGEFSYNNIDYIIYLKNKHFFGAKKEKRLLTNEENRLMQDVLKQILPSGAIISLKKTIYNHNYYQHYLDLNNNIHYFYGQNINDLINLCYLYNNEEEYVLDKHLDKEKIREMRYKRLVKINKTLITINISILAFLTIIPLIKPDIGKYINNPVSLAIREIDKREMTLEEVYDYLDKNPYLSQEEKEYIHRYEDFIVSELPYTNYQDLKDNLLNMRTFYHNELGQNLGTWSYSGKNKYNIDIYYCGENLALNPQNYNIFSHEVLHAFTVNYKHEPSYLNPFYEFLNMVLNNEYASNEENISFNYDKGYSFLNNEGFAIMELFNPETLRNFHANFKGDILFNELEMIIPDKNLAISLFNTFNDYYNLITSHVYTNEERDSLKNSLKEIIAQYYEAKYQKPTFDDIYMLYLLDSNKLIDELASHNQDYTIEFKIVHNKYYFNQNLPQDYQFLITLKIPETNEIIQEMYLDSTNKVEELYTFVSQRTK